MPSQNRHQDDPQPACPAEKASPPDPSVLDAIPHGIGLIDPDRRVRFANATLLNQIGCTTEMILGKPILEIIPDPDHPRFAAWLDHALLGPGPAKIERVAVRRCHGEPFDADIAIGDANAIPGRRAISVTDITARREAEQAEARGRRLLAAHFESTPLAVIEWRPDRSVRAWNPSAERIFGFAFHEVESRDVFPLIVEEASREIVDEVWDQLLRNTGGTSSINTNITKDGRVIQCRWHNTTLLDENQRVIGVASLAEDITEQVRAQREISQARARLERVIDKIPVIVWALDENLVPVLWNEHAERITGYSAAQIIGNRAFFELLYPSDAERAAWFRTWADLDFGDYDEVERSVTCADGIIRRILWSNIAARCPIPGWRAWGVGINVTDRHEAFEALRESERRYRDILQNVDLAGVVTDEQGRILFANEFFLNLTGWTEQEIVGIGWRRIFIPPLTLRPEEVNLGLVFDLDQLPPRAEGQLVTKSGTRRSIVWMQSRLRDTRGRFIGACALGMDVTDHRHAEAELAAHRDDLERLVEQRTLALAESQRRLEDAERLAALGRLATGLSHDLSNMLLPVRCHLDTISDADLNEMQRVSLNAVRTGIEFVDDLGEGLALLAGESDASASNGPSISPPFSVENWAREMLPLFEQAVTPGIEFSLTVDAPGALASIPKHLFSRAAMNLLVNAVEALGRSSNPEASITFAVRALPAQALLRVQCVDNGPGISDTIARRAPEPFFTTKVRGLSTGLGLSIVAGIAKLAGGTFVLENRPSGGAVATLDIPLHNSDATTPAGRPLVRVAIRDSRIAALCEQLLTGLGCTLVSDGAATPPDLVVVSREEKTQAAGGHRSDPSPPRRVEVDPAGGVAGIRQSLAAGLGPVGDPP